MMSSKIGFARLPEISTMIAAFATSGDRVKLSSVSKSWWTSARPFVWETVGASSLVALIIGRRLIDKNKKKEPNAEDLRRLLPETESEFSLSRFLIYAPYVRNLGINGGAILNEPILRALLRHFHDTSRPLLPNLERLLIQSPTGSLVYTTLDSGFGNPEDRALSDIETLIILFLGPAVHTLGLYCQYLTVSPSFITSRSPNIKDIRLGYGREVSLNGFTADSHRKDSGYDPSTDILAPAIGVEVTPGTWPRACITAAQSWHSLSRLTVNGHFLRHIDLEGLSDLLALKSLRIFGPYDGVEWEEVFNADVDFLQLHELTLESTTSYAAAHIFGCASLMRSITHLCWLTSPIPRQFPRGNQLHQHVAHSGPAPPSRWLAQAIINLSRTGRLIEQMQFSFDDDTTEEMRLALESLPLQKLEIYVQCWRGGNPQVDMTLLTGATQDLRSYTIHRMAVKLNHLLAIATAYPTLSSLSLRIDPTCVVQESSIIASVSTCYEQDIFLFLDFSFSLWPDMDDRDVGTTMEEVIQYICEIWPNHQLILVDYSSPFWHFPGNRDRGNHLNTLFRMHYKSIHGGHEL